MTTDQEQAKAGSKKLSVTSVLHRPIAWRMARVNPPGMCLSLLMLVVTILFFAG